MMLESESSDVVEDAKSQNEIPEESPSQDEVLKESLLVDDVQGEALTQDGVLEEIPMQDEVQEEDEILTTTADPPESRFQRFLKMSIRWVVGGLLVFSLGFMSAVLLLYIPERDGKSQLEVELTQAETRIDTLESEIIQLEKDIQGYIESKDVLASEVEAMQEELNSTSLHYFILSALADINAARIALVNDDIAGARVHLTNTNKTFIILKKLVDTEQRDKVLAMQNRLALVIAEIDETPSVAQSDLEVLANTLTMLENIFFAKP